MQPRKQKLLQGIVELYTENAEPVGSQKLLNFCDLNISSATVRNELKSLEQNNYVIQPHTSAGRVPTAEAYRYYVKYFLKPSVPQEVLQFIQSNQASENLDQVKNLAQDIKQFAKFLAEELGQMVFIVFSKDQLYYTGLSNLFAKPEFADQGTVQNVSQLLDRFDEIAYNMFGLVKDKDLHIHIGEGNPFGKNCAIMHSPFRIDENQNSLIGVLGPTRMNYNKVIGVMRAAKQYLDAMK